MISPPTRLLICASAIPLSLCAPAPADSPTTRKHLALTRDDLAHGQQQVRNMLRDRPAMATHVQEGDVIWTWAARRFAGEELGERIWWNPSLPGKDATSDCRSSDANSHARIRIRPAATMTWSGETLEIPLDFSHLWMGAVFELYNLCNSEGFNRIDQDAFLGKLTKRDYVDGIAKLEYRATRRTVDFYNLVWVPWARSKELDPEEFLGHVYFKPTYEEWVAQYGDSPSEYPEVPYGTYYDTHIALRTGKFPQARWLRAIPYLHILAAVAILALAIYSEMRARRLRCCPATANPIPPPDDI